MSYLSSTEYESKSGVFLIFCGLCIVIYLHKKNQLDALLYSQFILIINLYMFHAQTYLLMMSSKLAQNM